MFSVASEHCVVSPSKGSHRDRLIHDSPWCALGHPLRVHDGLMNRRTPLPLAHLQRSFRPEPLVTREELTVAVERHSGAAGVKHCREALPQLRSPVDSPPETMLRLAIISRGLPEPRVNCPVPVRGGVLHADLGYPDLKIAIEYEGAYHFDDGPLRAR